MHPYQDQTNRMWNFIKLWNQAQKSGYWLEFICLSYILLEIELRHLLSSKAGENSIPLPPKEINEQEYLYTLGKLAWEKKFIDNDIWKRIQDFNKKRRNAIHSLAQGKISYDDLKETFSDVCELINDIQRIWLPYKVGPEERNPSFRNPL